MKYNLEEKIDFFAELKKTDLNISKDLNNVENENNICLITCDLLKEKFVTLSCGHKFNYLPLYNDILNHKEKFNSMESRSNHLKLDEIRCPYCRKKQVGILPYYEELGLEKKNGVNIINDFNKSKNTFSYESKYCVFITNEIEKIDETFTPIYCNANKMVKLEKDNKDDPWFCCLHKKKMISKEKKEKKEKERQELKKEKEELKEKKILLKLEMKKEIDKNKKKQNYSNPLSKVDELNELILEENKIVEFPLNTCVCILKTGLNKGKPCGSKTIYMNSLCKRHFI
jgi:vacuolar-type H+-ATPase subunit I/STV1